MQMTAKEMERLLIKHGYTAVRQNGSHRVFYNRETKITVSVPMHRGDMRIGTEKQILKMTGLRGGKNE